MLVTQFIRLLQMLGLVALQVLVLNHIHLLGYATPLVCVAFLLFFPLNASRIGTLLWAFALGLTVDIFSNTPGMCSASMTFVAMLNPLLLRVFSPRDAAEDMRPSYATMGRWAHIRYIAALVMVHHSVFFLLESLTFRHPLQLFLGWLGSVVLSVLLIAALETLRDKSS